MSISTFAELKSAAADWLNRSDLTSVIPNFIVLAEARLKRDPRVRRLENHGALSVDAEEETLPTDLLSLEALYHDGTTYYGPIEIVPQEVLALKKAQYGNSGAPRFAAVVEGSLILAPVPDSTYSLTLSYWQGITALSDANTSNWLLTSHPDVYLYATLVESAPYLKDDARATTWAALLEERLEGMRLDAWNRQWSGTMRRQFEPFGG